MGSVSITLILKALEVCIAKRMGVVVSTGMRWMGFARFVFSELKDVEGTVYACWFRVGVQSCLAA